MKKLLLIARSNLRKAKGQTVAISILMILAAMLFNLWLMLAMDYKANFERYHDQLNAEHVTISVDGDKEEVRNYLGQTFENEARISEYRLDSCLNMTGNFSYNGGQMNGWFIFLPKNVALTRSIGKAEIVEEGNLTSGVYLPMLYKSNDIQIGKKFEITIGSHTIEYTICGFFNSIMMGSHNCALTEMILTPDKYEELADLEYALPATLCSIRLNNKKDCLIFESELKSKISETYPNILMTSNSYDIVVQACYISQMICSGIMSAMAFFVLLITLAVIASNIDNYIQVNMKNLGVLKAIGYTSRQLIFSLLLQFVGLTVVTAMIGVGLSYGLFPAVNRMMISQTGIPYVLRFLPLPAFVSLLILGGAVALAVWISSRKIKRIEPIVALRSGVQTHNFKRNPFPLEKTKAPLTTALALKTTLSSMKHNITICITMLVLSLVVVFSGLMVENAITDFTPFANLIIGETADSCINVQTKIEDNFIKDLNADSRVEKVYLWNSLNVSHVGGAELMATLSDDFSKVNNPDSVFKGRFPKYDNEIAIGAKYAKEEGLEIGNEIEIKANGEKAKYLISGFTQVSNNLGRDCLMTRQGYERLGMLSNTSYYINLVEGTDIDAFNAEMQERFADSLYASINIKTTMEAASSVYISLVTIIVIAILVLSLIIIAFVLYLLVRTTLNNKMRDYGIMKSLGFTTRQLILQTALSFMPAIICSTIVGLTISSFVINPLVSIFFSGIGVVKCTFKIPVGFTSISGIGLIIFAFAMMCLLSLKIKKITPRKLLSQE